MAACWFWVSKNQSFFYNNRIIHYCILHNLGNFGTSALWSSCNFGFTWFRENISAFAVFPSSLSILYLVMFNQYTNDGNETSDSKFLVLTTLGYQVRSLWAQLFFNDLSSSARSISFWDQSSLNPTGSSPFEVLLCSVCAL